MPLRTMPKLLSGPFTTFQLNRLSSDVRHYANFDAAAPGAVGFNAAIASPIVPGKRGRSPKDRH